MLNISNSKILLENKINRILVFGALALFGSAIATETLAQTAVGSPDQAPQAAGSIDFAHAKPVPRPQLQAPPPPESATNAAAVQKLLSSPGIVKGSDSGDNKLSPVQLVPAIDFKKAVNSNSEEIAPQQFGTSKHPFTTARTNAYSSSTTTYYPFRAAGKLFFKIGSSTYLCSASLIKPGVIVTAAHCVANFGSRQFYNSWVFVPAYNNGTAPYGTYTGRRAYVLTSYLNGTDSCAVAGVVCRNDVAVIVLNKQGTVLPGQRTGWLGYGWNGFGYNTSGQALITQLGYPVALNSGVLQQRNNSQGFVSTSLSNNTVIGSLETGGSSGGPWAVNLGYPPVLNGTSVGTYPTPNVVVGVTSWGYTSTSIKQQGAAPFLSTNITVLVNTACAANVGYC